MDQPSGSPAVKANYLIVFAAVIFLVLVGIYWGTTSSKWPPEAPNPRQVVVAVHNLEMGTLIRDSDVKIEQRSGPLFGATAKISNVLGRGVISPISENEPVLEDHLVPRGAGNGLAATIPVGMRAIAVRVEQNVASLLPGTRVDVLLPAPSTPSAACALTLKSWLFNIEVLSATSGSVNLLVTPEQAETLAGAVRKNPIYLIVRNSISQGEASGGRIGLMSVPEAPGQAALASPEVDVLRQSLNAKDEAERGRQEIERQKVALEAQRERLRDYTRIVLSLLIIPTCMFVVVRKGTSPKQKTIAASIAGALIAFWFAAPK